MRPVTVTYSLTADQFIAACNALWSDQAIGTKGNQRMATTLAVATGVSWVYVPVATFFLALATAFFASASLLRNCLWRRHYSTLVKYSGPITATFSGDAVDFHSAEGTHTQTWAIFNGYTYTADYIFLHVSLQKARGQFSIIPKSALSTPDDLAGLLTLISARLPKRAKRLF